MNDIKVTLNQPNNHYDVGIIYTMDRIPRRGDYVRFFIAVNSVIAADFPGISVSLQIVNVSNPEDLQELHIFISNTPLTDEEPDEEDKSTLLNAVRNALFDAGIYDGEQPFRNML